MPERTRVGPPGVDVNSFHPCPKEEAAIGLSRLADKLASGETAAWGGEAGAAEALRKLDPFRDRIVSYIGKLIVSKGVDLLLAAWRMWRRLGWSSWDSGPTGTHWPGSWLRSAAGTWRHCMRSQPGTRA